MLIQCDRHTKKDLELWEDYEEIDRVYYASYNMKRIEEKAIEEIKQFVAKENYYISVSWGKDSVVMAHLCYRAGVISPYVWIMVEPIYNPYCLDVREIFLKNFPVNYEEIVTHCIKDNTGLHATGTLERGFKEAAKKYGKRYISGIVKYESGQRTLSRIVHGVSTDNCCRPIIDWKTEAVYAYLTHYNLPVHPNYAMLGGGRYDRNRIRVTSLGGKRGDGMGRAEWEKEYYPDKLAKLAIY